MMRIILLLILLLFAQGCGKETNKSNLAERNVEKSKDKKNINNNKTNIYLKQESVHISPTNNIADFSKIIKEINESKDLLDIDERIDAYTAKMFQKSGYDCVDRPKRARALFRTGKIIPGRILSVKDIAALCKNSLNEVTEELSDLIDRSFTDCPGKRLPVEDAVAILNYLIENGSTDVVLQSQVNLGTYFNRIKEYGEKGLELQLEAIQKAQNMNYSIDKILQWKANSIQSLLYLDRLEEADLKAEELFNEYEEKRKNVKEWDDSWECLIHLYYKMITAWKFEDTHHAMELCKKIQNGKSEMIKKYDDPYRFKDTYKWLLKRANKIK